MDQQFVSTKLAETFRAYETIQMLPKYEFLSRSEQNPGNYDQKVPARDKGIIPLYKGGKVSVKIVKSGKSNCKKCKKLM